jgi:hypothetical protein
LQDISEIKFAEVHFKHHGSLAIGVGVEDFLKFCLKGICEDIANAPGEKMTPDEVAFSIESVDIRDATLEEVETDAHNSGAESIEEMIATQKRILEEHPPLSGYLQ